MGEATATGQAAGFLEPDLERRFGGLARLYGAKGAQAIRAAHVVVVGLGGVGSWAAEALARSGVAALTLIDLDNVAESNINRQVHALSDTVGKAKIDAMRERIALINPECQVTCIEEFVNADNWPGIADLGNLDAAALKNISIIDACDQVRAKTAIAAWAIAHKVRFISVGAAGGKRLAHKVDIDDLSLTTHDPLLAQLRYRLRREHGAARTGKIGVACVFSREAVMQPAAVAALAAREEADAGEETACAVPDAAVDQSAPDAGDGSLNCHGYGSVVSVTATFGLCASGWLLNEISKSSAKSLKSA
ncbi:MAG: tRNA threonylcarbamoyladenosine dehydratase [Comamonadaceae bacterium]|nr:MAG: tRNA threonylcarbamoyladenosine dehydratase [Comamonadaceae bacterium]